MSESICLRSAADQAAGLPCGLQIVAGHLRDRESLAFAEFMERELGGSAVPPGYE